MSSNQNKVMILHPDFKDPGGISNYYLKLTEKLTVPKEHFFLGKRPDESGYGSLLFRLAADYIRFLKLLNRNHYHIIHLNPSLGFKGFLREGLFNLLALLYKKKTIVFWRGWAKPFAKKIERNYLWLFKFLYGRTDAFIVLAKEFQDQLESWGCNQPIFREVTVIDDTTLEGFDIEKGLEARQNSEAFRILFLARMLKEKGIFEAIDAYAILKIKHPSLRLVIAGDGVDMESVKSYVVFKSLPDIEFAGYVSGKNKYALYKQVNMLLFPSYTEGFPNTVVEAMAFGLPIVTRDVGGLVDFFEDKNHGFMTHSKDPVVFADLIEQLINDTDLYRKITLSNYQYAQDNFLASRAASRIINIYKELVKAHE